MARGLSKTGKKSDLISRLEQQKQKQQQQRRESFIKQESNEMQIDSVPIHQQQQQQQHQQQEVPASPHISGSGTSLEHIKYEYESTMNIDEIPAENSSVEQNTSSNVDMPNEYPQSSIDPVEQQKKIDQPLTVSSSVATSPIITQPDVSKVEASANNISIEPNNHDQSKSTEPLEKTCSTHQKDDTRSEVERELARLMSERKCGTLKSNNSRMFSMGIMMNQGQPNGVPYDYDFLLDIVQKSHIYNDGEIPEWLSYDYDTTLGTRRFGESEVLCNIGILSEELFLPIPIVTNSSN
ncbi:hypothetical protein GLOIN_2v1765482 [Rhizophagus clarus]|nr:hypothetical protein GLOIN_2v1765482 [Rhizophagus clarus]